MACIAKRIAQLSVVQVERDINHHISVFYYALPKILFECLQFPCPAPNRHCGKFNLGVDLVLSERSRTLIVTFITEVNSNRIGRHNQMHPRRSE